MCIRDRRKIEKEMERIAKRSQPFQRLEVTRDEAKRRLATKGQHYKIEAVDLIPEGETITFLTHGDWEDLCEGPHVDTLTRCLLITLDAVD